MTNLKVIGIIENSKSLSSKQSLAAIRHIKKQLKMLEDRGTDKMQIAKVKNALIENATKDLIEVNGKELERLNAQLLQLKQNYVNDYEKNYSKRIRDIDNAKRKIMAMSDTEVAVQAVSIMDKKLSENVYPEILEEISIELKRNNSELFEPFRKYLKNNNYDSPWLNSPIGSDIKGDIEFIQNNIGTLMLKMDDGRRGVVNFDDLDSFLEYGEATE